MALIAFGFSAAPLAAQETGTRAYDLLPLELGRQLPGDPELPAGIGIPVDSFLVLPRLDGVELYNDNIYAKPSGRQSDFVTSVGGDIDAYSRWTSHALNVHGYLEQGLYARHAQENYLDYSVSADGHFDIHEAAQLYLTAQANRGHFDRGSPDDAQGLTPTFYDTRRAEARYDQAFGRFLIEATVLAHNYEYEHVPLKTGYVDTDHQDRTEYVSSVKLEYELIPNEYGIFIRGQYTDTDYRLLTIQNQNLDSITYEAVMGIEAKVQKILVGEAFAGLLRQQYRSSDFQSYTGPTFGVRLSWAPTLLTKLQLTADRTIEDTAFNGSSGFFQNAVAFAIDHELHHNLMLRFAASYADRSYRGIFLHEDVYDLSFGARYELDKYLYIGSVIGYTDRRSSLPSDDFTQMRIGFHITGQM